MIYQSSNYASQREDRLFEQFPALLTPLEVMDILGVGKNTVSASELWGTTGIQGGEKLENNRRKSKRVYDLIRGRWADGQID